MNKIGQYKIKKTLGVGTVGTVYAATEGDGADEVALKVLHPSISSDENIQRRFRREMEILAKLNHPNIVRYLGKSQQGTQFYYVMELVDDGTVKDQLRQHGRLSWQQAVRYAIQVCSALQHSHNFGIIHRDLKPANLFLTPDGKIKIGDYGIARDTTAMDLTDVGMTVGTYAYMAPEQIRADKVISDKTDLYALGCLMFELITGHQPFPGTNFAQIFDQHLSSPPPSASALVPECPADLDMLIRELMAKQPEDRPFNARYVQGFLQEVLEENSEEPEIVPTAAVSNFGLSNPGDSEFMSDTSASISWTKLAMLGLVIVGLVLVAMQFNS